ncbi:PLDc N-terminal domain-containing protein [Maribacter sp. ACAM166]|uniref:PLDc N-terminal domain-containing protein n=1 Tax=Maribacter sp. ACAM166 TaxID=2508996 RepID=UPI002017D792|nr:PLD nuclease N-terminal domain-containing protein [Maribacter sp. ACAM166]
MYCLVDVLRHKFKNDSKTTWFLIVFFLPFLGALRYLFTGKNRRIKSVRNVI